MINDHRTALSTMLFAGIKPRPEGYRETNFIEVQDIVLQERRTVFA